VEKNQIFLKQKFLIQSCHNLLPKIGYLNPPFAGDVTTVAKNLLKIGILTDTINMLANNLLSDFNQHADSL